MAGAFSAPIDVAEIRETGGRTGESQRRGMMTINGKMALVDFHKCSPTNCEAGICTAVEACKRKLLVQEAPYDTPMTSPFSCRACGDCARACPAKAILITPS